MRKIVALFLGALLFYLSACASGPSTGGGQQRVLAKETLQDMYVTWLNEKGLNPEIDDDGDVKFTYKIEGVAAPFFIMVDEKDTQFFQVSMIGGWNIESEAERQEALLAASYANGANPVGKIFVTRAGDNIWASGQLLLNQPEDFKAVFDRVMESLVQAIIDFVSKM
jgi:hypothetical protein